MKPLARMTDRKLDPRCLQVTDMFLASKARGTLHVLHLKEPSLGLKESPLVIFHPRI